MILPIRLKPVEVHIHADRRLAFQVLTAFGGQQDDGSSSTVLQDAGDRKLVEFHSLMPTPRDGGRFYRTVEWVTLREPEEIRFEGVEGPLDLLHDRFLLRDVGGCTLFRYESTFGLEGGSARYPSRSAWATVFTLNTAGTSGPGRSLSQPLVSSVCYGAGSRAP